MRYDIKPIETWYRGILYRSRLEAKWAAMFDECGWSCSYEAIDLGGYIPDFVLKGRRPILAEVKPFVEWDEFIQYGEWLRNKVRGSGWEHEVLILGSDPNVGVDLQLGHLVGAALASRWNCGKCSEWCDDDCVFGQAAWARCSKCRQPGLFEPYGPWRLRPCGHYGSDDGQDGSAYLGSMDSRKIHDLWARACNAVRWEPKNKAA